MKDCLNPLQGLSLYRPSILISIPTQKAHSLPLLHPIMKLQFPNDTQSEKVNSFRFLDNREKYFEN